MTEEVTFDKTFHDHLEDPDNFVDLELLTVLTLHGLDPNWTIKETMPWIKKLDRKDRSHINEATDAALLRKHSRGAG